MQGTQSESGDTPRDRRGRPRVTVAVPFQMFDHHDRLLLAARTLDLSTAGALLHGICKTEVGSDVRVEISRGSARNPLALQAKVVRLHAPRSESPLAAQGNHGIAVRFDGINTIDETVLMGIIRNARS